MITRVPQEPESPDRLHRHSGRETGTDNSQASGGASAIKGNETRTQRWYRQVKATKRGATGGRESEHPIVPTKSGNHPEDRAGGGKGMPCHDAVGGKHGGCIGTRERVHETTTDRGTRPSKGPSKNYVQLHSQNCSACAAHSENKFHGLWYTRHGVLESVTEGESMPQQEVHHCRCSNCFSPDHHPDQEIHRQMNLLLSRLDERQRRWYAAVESARLGHGGDRSVSRLTGLHVDTIRRGREELAASLQDRPADRVRLSGGRRPALEKKSLRSSRPS